MGLFTATALLLLGGGSVSVNLPLEATSSGLELAVGDIATITGDDPSLVARVRSASLGYAPAPGYSRVLRADLIQASLRSALPGVELLVTGAPRCRVSPAVTVLTGAAIQAEAAKALRGSLIGIDANAVPEGTVADLQVPKGPVEPRMVPKLGDLNRSPGIQLVPVEIWLGDSIFRSVHVSFRVSIWKRSAVLSRAVNVGDRLHAGLFEVKRIPLGEARDLQALTQAELGGAVALRPIPAGSIVVERDVHREVIVKRGDRVTVRLQKGSVRVSDGGVALADARMGERIRVQLGSTGRELLAEIDGPRSAVVKIQ